MEGLLSMVVLLVICIEMGKCVTEIPGLFFAVLTTDVKCERLAVFEQRADQDKADATRHIF